MVIVSNRSGKDAAASSQLTGSAVAPARRHVLHPSAAVGRSLCVHVEAGRGPGRGEQRPAHARGGKDLVSGRGGRSHGRHGVDQRCTWPLYSFLWTSKWSSMCHCPATTSTDRSCSLSRCAGMPWQPIFYTSHAFFDRIFHFVLTSPELNHTLSMTWGVSHEGGDQDCSIRYKRY